MKKIEDLTPEQTKVALKLMFQKDQAMAVKTQAEGHIEGIIKKLNAILADDPTPKQAQDKKAAIKKVAKRKAKKKAKKK